MIYLIDTSAWIEYIEGSSAGEKVSNYLNNESNEILTTPVNIAETIAKVKKIGGNVELAYNIIVSSSSLIELTSELSKEAGILYVQQREKNGSFGLIDAIVIKAAQMNNAKLVTKDQHFKNFKETIII